MSSQEELFDRSAARKAFKNREFIIDRLMDDRKIYQKYADKNFRCSVHCTIDQLSQELGNENYEKLETLSDHIVQRWWEMHVGIYLLESGFNIIPTSDRIDGIETKNLDQHVKLDGKNVWIECVCPERGGLAGLLPLMGSKVTCVTPEDPIRLRVFNSIYK